MSNNNKLFIITISVIAICAVVYIVYSNQCDTPVQTTAKHTNNRHPMSSNIENFYNDSVNPMTQQFGANQQENNNTSQDIIPSGDIQFIEQPLSFDLNSQQNNNNQLPSECYPKNVLTSLELLPTDSNSLWAQVSPSGQGSLADQNFLTSGFHIGINTVGQSLRNANHQLRSEPLNPQVKVSPWGNTTIEPDINRRPLEIS